MNRRRIYANSGHGDRRWSSAACSSSSSGERGGSGTATQRTQAASHYVPPADPIATETGTRSRPSRPSRTRARAGSSSRSPARSTRSPATRILRSTRRQTWMVDGWNWKIDKYIVVVDHITLWSEPEQEPVRPVAARLAGRARRRSVRRRPAQGRPARRQGRRRRAGARHRGARTTRTTTAAPRSTRRPPTASGSAPCRRPATAARSTSTSTASEQADYQYMVQGRLQRLLLRDGDVGRQPGGAQRASPACAPQTSTNASADDDGRRRATTEGRATRRARCPAATTSRSSRRR